LYWRILGGMLLGVAAGLALGSNAEIFRPFSEVILQLLGALAPPLILIAVVHVLMTSDIPRSSVARLAGLLLLNTCVAIFIGLGVANLLQPGKSRAGTADASESGTKQTTTETPSEDTPAAPAAAASSSDSLQNRNVAENPNPVSNSDNGDDLPSSMEEPESRETGAGELRANPLDQLISKIPRSVLGPLGDSQNVIGVIVIAVAFGIALRSVKQEPIGTMEDLVELAYRTLLIVLHWIIELVPIGVACVVAAVIGTEGFDAFWSLGAFVLAVLLALCLQTGWYLLRIQFFSWVRPLQMLKGMRDALIMAFSTDSSTATMPVTYACLTEKVGVREKSASLGALVGANFNNDGTALYEAMAALFVAQMVGMDLDLTQQLTVVVTSILASIGAAGIPEAGIVTMTLVFTAVGLPIEKIPILLTVDWFLDRCRTTINVLGDVNVACILDGRTPPTESTMAE
jgi:DAACS family dicarboxylate/amino acid:cation (Na+ or H+) symporter